MNPNSSHQRWSRWTATITPDPLRPLVAYDAVRENCARFYRKAFGSVTALRIVQNGTWTIDCRTEGAPAHDPGYFTYLCDQLEAFYLAGFGPKALVSIEVTLEAGSREDGRPPDQLILGSAPIILVNRLLKERDRE